MSEVTGKYEVEENDENAIAMLRGEQPAAEIHPPKTIPAVYKKGLGEQKVWGWVKTSTKFIYHIKRLKGAKLAIWNVIALSIDEDGTCKLSIPEIANLAGYSNSETRETVQELDELGYLSVSRKPGRKSLYSPTFAARSASAPKDGPLQKNDPSRKTTPPVPSLQSAPDPSSPPREKTHSSIKELKESLLKDGKKPKKEKKAATPQPPEIILFRSVAEHYPTKPQRPLVIDAIQKIGARLAREVTAADLLPFWMGWANVSKNEWSLVWLTEWAVSGVLPGKQQKPSAFQNTTNILGNWLAGKEQEHAYE